MNKELPTEAILSIMTNLREAMPKTEVPPPPAPRSGGAVDSIEDFEYETVLEGLETTMTELGAVIEATRAKAIAQALEVYYAAEDLARDPAHAEVIPHVQAMRRAYEEEFGTPIPPRRRGEGTMSA